MSCRSGLLSSLTGNTRVTLGHTSHVCCKAFVLHGKSTQPEVTFTKTLQARQISPHWTWAKGNLVLKYGNGHCNLSRLCTLTKGAHSRIIKVVLGVEDADANL